jgi:quercetin dioxygenase-like cupin family protein
MANIFEPEWVERDQPPLIGRAARVGPQAGAERLGATLYEIDPGGYGSPFHLHHGNEELIIVLAGRPSLRTLDGIRELEPGDVVACPVGAGRASAAEQQRRTGSRARHQHDGLSRDRRAARQRQDPRPHRSAGHRRPACARLPTRGTGRPARRRAAAARRPCRLNVSSGTRVRVDHSGQSSCACGRPRARAYASTSARRRLSPRR